MLNIFLSARGVMQPPRLHIKEKRRKRKERKKEREQLMGRRDGGSASDSPQKQALRCLTQV